MAARAARALGLPGLYRSPSAWGGDAFQPPESAFPRREWVARCQAASFEIAVPLGRAAVPFVEENAFGPFAALHGTALRSLLRLAANGEVDPSPWTPPSIASPSSSRTQARKPWTACLGSIPARPPSVSTAASAAPSWRGSTGGGPSPLRGTAPRHLGSAVEARPRSGRRFLPDLQGLMTRGGEHALAAAVLVRTLDPRDPKAREALRRFANEHPDPRVRDALETHLRPPRPVPGGRA